MIRLIKPRAAPAPRLADEPIRRFVAVLASLEARPRPGTAVSASPKPAKANVPRAETGRRR
ncbi:hypothetical protein E8L99_13055 [Phreatobacter aquaticus]|uniref:Uncharacterized protein n=1 Tax=Phreatobacter aquaticus TaxID=2570229 RepID=A0A4D7QH51_9HYPH|nr:hypothetical protein [Phreatobacter aquaticus]QCK86618.1 hypothetical protein E8L99_13055 [Phreatobacter aquaticus]